MISIINAINVKNNTQRRWVSFEARGVRTRLTSVVKLAAVVGGGEEGDQLALCKEFVTILHHLNFTYY